MAGIMEIDENDFYTIKKALKKYKTKSIMNKYKYTRRVIRAVDNEAGWNDFKIFQTQYNDYEKEIELNYKNRLLDKQKILELKRKHFGSRRI